MGKGTAEVKVEQTNVQNQETNIATNTLSNTVDGLLDVLKAQAANPASYYPITVFTGQGQTGAQGYQNNNVSDLLTLMYLNTARGQQNAEGQPEQIKTIFIAAVIIVIAIFVGRRLKL